MRRSETIGTVNCAVRVPIDPRGRLPDSREHPFLPVRRLLVQRFRPSLAHRRGSDRSCFFLPYRFGFPPPGRISKTFFPLVVGILRRFSDARFAREPAVLRVRTLAHLTLGFLLPQMIVMANHAAVAVARNHSASDYRTSRIRMLRTVSGFNLPVPFFGCPPDCG